MRSGAGAKGRCSAPSWGALLFPFSLFVTETPGRSSRKDQVACRTDGRKLPGKCRFPTWLFQKEIHAIEIDDGMTVVQRVHP
jgi:hypothetical protein